jgi:hypothetical protein
MFGGGNCSRITLAFQRHLGLVGRSRLLEGFFCICFLLGGAMVAFV